MANPTSGSNQSPNDFSGQLRSQMKDGVRAVSDEVSDLAKEASDGGKALYEAGHEQLRADIEQLKATLSKMGDKAVRQGEASLNAVTEVVAERPLLSLCGAFAAGVVLSLLLSGRRPS